MKPEEDKDAFVCNFVSGVIIIYSSRIRIIHNTL